MMRNPLPLLCTATLMLSASQALAHGTMVVPESRVYNCFLNNPENPSDPACAAAKDFAGTQAFYDWNGINQAAANGNHRAVVPDGQLCAGGNAKFAGLDLARADWQATPIAPKSDGTFEFEFWATAPHATQEWVFYVTRQGYTPDTPLKWSDLFEFCRLGEVPLSANNRYKLNCPLPPVSGKHVIYTTWQRSDSGEAFYTCTDVILGNAASPWADEGDFSAQTDLAEGSSVTLRLFNSSGNDMESVRYTVTAGATSAADWAYGFARMVNNHSQYARIGVLDPNSGEVTPVRSADGNRVYTLADLNLSHEIDIQVPRGNNPPVAVLSAESNALSGAGNITLSAAASSDPDGDPLSFSWTVIAGSGASLSDESGDSVTLHLSEPIQHQTITVRVTVSDGQLTDSTTVDIDHSPGGTGGYDYVYPEAIGSYVPGETIVLGSDGKRYQCRPWPYGDWCNVNSAYHYAPGTGANWQDAWTQL
ncbi:Predicted carbohydrate-binding protein, contains CBM5 and CBM33 domains [Microbulbifer thermotolerans]|uniref:lytic polysaccharide monooxygenase auxiliary activity family 9 protein n=1 Tax=Microbulbifer thermotolerans TaxID=252514 RepID=UPI0008EE692F|nr:lytic polysaccharide monooxygenase [Microbulbifer thermotolerans]MCX2833669.1 lytic polysaccharide monooxygenase [Microbulbifer thermotolerans]SFB83831.1 Predicted carbohydrate-binding protein, contains CBM5 and CBM33 domains [Microbulbifer thermotolerans]